MKKTIPRCKKCVLSNAFPSIQFDDRGICNYCADEDFFKTNESTILSTQDKVLTLFHKHRGRFEYDAVLCYSGGKDSTYALIQTVKKYDLRVLTFTLDNGFMSPTAIGNIHTIVDNLGVDNIMFRPSMRFFKSLVKISALKNIYHPMSLQRISSVCNSCISLVNNTALKIAVEKQIPFIIAGFTLGQIPLRAIMFKNHYNFLKESREPYINKLRQHIGDEVNSYFYISDATISRTKQYPYTINILCLEDLNEDTIIEKISGYGWKPPADVDGCSSNCMLNQFNNYVHQLKYNFHPYEMELSQLVRAGQLSRDQAISKMSDSSSSQLEPVLQKLDMNLDELTNL